MKRINKLALSIRGKIEETKGSFFTENLATIGIVVGLAAIVLIALEAIIGTSSTGILGLLKTKLEGLF